MAQTKRKTKHRGNAAGVVESRGRTGRKPTAAEKSGKAGDAARAKAKLPDRRDRPPTWEGAMLRALVAALVLVLLSGVLLGAKPGRLVLYFVLAWALYTPMSYYIDRWILKRRMRNKAKRTGGGRTAP